MNILILFFISICASVAYAAGGGHHGEAHVPMTMVITQVANVALLIGIVWFAAGSKISAYFAGQKSEFMNRMEAASSALTEAKDKKNQIETRLNSLRANKSKDLADANAKADEEVRIVIANAKNDALKIEKDAGVALDAEVQKAVEALRVETFQKSAAFAEQQMGKTLTKDQQAAWNEALPQRLEKGVH